MLMCIANASVYQIKGNRVTSKVLVSVINDCFLFQSTLEAL